MLIPRRTRILISITESFVSTVPPDHWLAPIVDKGGSVLLSELDQLPMSGDTAYHPPTCPPGQTRWARFQSFLGAVQRTCACHNLPLDRPPIFTADDGVQRKAPPVDYLSFPLPPPGCNPSRHAYKSQTFPLAFIG